MVTGFGKNMRNILLALHEDPDIEVFEAANGVPYGRDVKTPWDSYGTYPSNPTVLKITEKDPQKKRAAQYGFYCIDDIVEKVQPDVFLGIEDIWAFKEYESKPWWDKTKKIIWTTLDSLPILDHAIEFEPKCDKMLVWASFAEKAMVELGHENVSTLHGAVDYSHFKPLENKNELRSQHDLDSDFVIGFVFKNQLRKSVPNLLEGFKRFKTKNPEISTKLLLHTDWGEKSMGWDIPRYLKEKDLENGEVLATYVCHNCDDYFVKPYFGEDKDCSSCGGEKSVKTKNSGKGVGEEQLNEIYNMMDVYCHPFTSGGQEIPIQEAKAAGLITLVTEYSCGTDSCYENQGGIPLAWNEYREPSTQFIKASTCPEDICNQLEKVYLMDKQSKSKLSETGIKYVKEKFSVETTIQKLKQIIKEVCIDTSENEKEDVEPETPVEKVSIEKFLEEVPLENRIAVILPRSAGDVLMANSLMENLQSLYPDKKIFFVTLPENYDLINDNPHVYKVIPYSQNFENLSSIEGRGQNKGIFDMAFLLHSMTQKTHSYIHNGKDKNQFELR